LIDYEKWDIDERIGLKLTTELETSV
jgi:hypothetical protein